MRPISVDLRERVIEAHGEGISFGKIAKRFKLPKGTVQRLIEHYRLTGSVTPKPPRSGRKPAFCAEALRMLEAHILAHPDATLAELRDQIGLSVSLVAVHYVIKRKLGFVRKKSRYTRANSNGLT